SRRTASCRMSISFLPAVSKRESAEVASPTSSFCLGVRARWTPHQWIETLTAAAVLRRRWAGLSAFSGISVTVNVVTEDLLSIRKLTLTKAATPERCRGRGSRESGSENRTRGLRGQRQAWVWFAGRVCREA